MTGKYVITAAYLPINPQHIPFFFPHICTMHLDIIKVLCTHQLMHN